MHYDGEVWSEMESGTDAPSMVSGEVQQLMFMPLVNKVQ